MDIGFGTFVPRGWILGLDLFGHVGGYWVWIFSQEEGLGLELLFHVGRYWVWTFLAMRVDRVIGF